MTAWLAFDGIMNLKYGLESTLSYLLWWEAYNNPVIPMLFGLVVGLFLGHTFWSADPYKPDPNKPPQ
jgi:hypothetical protein